MTKATYGNMRGHVRRNRRKVSVVTVLALAAGLVAVLVPDSAGAATSPCGASINPIACENSQTTGVTDPSIWDIHNGGAGDPSVQGFATDISVNAGSAVNFKITASLAYSINIYRLGYYGGSGARLWQSNLAHTTTVQPSCLTNSSVGLVDCGNWSVSATWNVPSTAVSGVYVATLERTDAGGKSQIPFVVRNDSSTSDIVYQTSDATWQAYNRYGGADFYTGSATNLYDSPSRARKVSYNRPFATRGDNDGRDYLFSSEFPTIRFLEQNGYDVSYITDIDTDRLGSSNLTKHKVFLSVGHDEYWSNQQRANVQTARDAGVNLMFLSGNEVYWHTRYEASIDGTNTSYRTLVCYKETWDNSNSDPTGEPTSTWRDPRFTGTPANTPENALTGTMYMSNATDLPITVSSTEGKTRLWRDAGLNTMAAGTTTSLTPHTVGYESDEDIDNGFRPAGLIDLSTSTGNVTAELQDFGNTTANGVTTHHLTLYRAASGALVFSAGTLQWGWGLDAVHDGTTTVADSRMQQATANMFADMSALPTTLMAGLMMPTKSSDTVKPTVTVTAPTANANVANGTLVTVTGTATDTGGVVAGVEVSLDGGTRWHPATGTTSWSYSGAIHGNGVTAIRVRATDDSANTSDPVTVNQNVACPCSLFGDQVPARVDGGDGGATELGVRLTPAIDGFITGIRFYKASSNTGTHTGSLWTTSGSLLATGTFSNETATGWQTLAFASPVSVTAGSTYVASYFAPNGHYSADQRFFYYSDYSASPLSAQSTTADGTKFNGVYASGHAFPSSTYVGSNYYVDATFVSTAVITPVVQSTSPSNNATDVAINGALTATFNKSLNTTGLSFTVKDAANQAVVGTTTYNAGTKTATFTPTTAFAYGANFTATVSGTDTDGNPLAPYSWSFRTIFQNQTGRSCPCTLFADSTSPSEANVQDGPPVQLGVKFTADTDGQVTGVRFYKGTLNVGTHTGSLWTASGTQLATGTYTGESTSGWQTLTFASPVAVTAGTTYIASYSTSSGYWSRTAGAFSSSGVDNFPLHVPVSGGLYTYGSGAPDQTSSANYLVDAVFTVPSNVVPAVTTQNPANGSATAQTSTTVSATFNTSILGGTTSITVTPSGGAAVAGSVSLDAVHKVLVFTPSSALTAGTTYTVAVNGARSLAGTPQSGTTTWTFTPAASFSCPCSMFGANATPANVDSADPSAVALGMKFTPSTTGYISGVKFYKSSANTGTHTGSIWATDGTRLGTVTFTGESASGWQTATLSSPVSVTAGTTYIVSYFTPTGHYSYDPAFFASTYNAPPLSAPAGSNGVYVYGGDSFPSNSYNSNNYWVDVVFQTGTAPPPPPPTCPCNVFKSTDAPATENVVDPQGSVELGMKFSPDVDGNISGVKFYKGSNNTGTHTGSLWSSGGQLLATATFSNETASGWQTVTFSNAVNVSANSTYIVSYHNSGTWSVTTNGLVGGLNAAPLHVPASGGVYQYGGSTVFPQNSTASNFYVDVVFNTGTVASPPPPTCSPCTVFADSSTPETQSVVDPQGSVELGMKFSSDQSGSISGIRFWKSSSDTGTHTGSLWTAAGTQLATGTFTGETASGWQTLTFASPVSITAATTYVVSFHDSAGTWATTRNQFQGAGVDNSPLHVPVGGGLFAYGSNTLFPANSSNSNYWVDVLFTTQPTDTVAPQVSGATGSGSGTTATIAWTTNEPATSRVDYGTAAGSLLSTASVAGLSTSHTVALAGLNANTRYYFRVTSADATGNTTTFPTAPAAPLSFAPTIAPFNDTTLADFTSGTTSSTYRATNADGEIVLAPVYAAEFTGTALPSGLTSAASVTGGKTTVASGVATVSGAKLTSAGYGSGRSIEAAATLTTGQSLGWVSSSVRFTLSVNSSNQLIATVNDGQLTNVTSTVATGWTATRHVFRVEWTSSAVTFYVDNVQRYTHSVRSLLTTLTAQFADPTTALPDLVIDWVRIAPYATSGTFASRVIDGLASIVWDNLSWDATVPSGTTLVVKVRTGNTATPDATWTAFTTVSASGGAIGATARYLQYQLTLTTSGSAFTSPELRAVTVTAHA